MMIDTNSLHLDTAIVIGQASDLTVIIRNIVEIKGLTLRRDIVTIKLTDPHVSQS